MKKQEKKIAILLLILLLPLSSLCQKKQDSLLSAWKNTRLEDTIRANSYHNYIRTNYFQKSTDTAYSMTLDLLKFTKEHQLKKQKADALILLGDIEHVFGNNTEASKHMSNSLEIYQQLQYKRGQAMALNGIGISYRKIFNLEDAKAYYEKSLAISQQIKDTLLIARTLMNIGNIYSWRYKTDEAMNYYKRSLKLMKRVGNKKEEAVILNNIGDAYIQKKDYKTAKTYIDSVITIGNTLDNTAILAHTYRVLGRLYFIQKKYDAIIEPAKKTLRYANEMSNRDYIDGAYYLLFEAYKGKKDFDSTIKYYDLRKTQRTTIDDIKSVKALEKVKIDNQRKEDSIINVAKALKIEIVNQRDKSNLKLAWYLSSALLIGFGVFVFSQIKKKQRKITFAKQLELEEKDKTLKTLELSALDAMIEGQEKERQRIAEDLHDNIGALMATIKLNVSALKDNITPKIIDNTSALIDEAYQKIRQISHAKNSRTIGKDGLISSLKSMADKISIANKLNIKIINYGAVTRLDHSLELMIFRSIQELITNVIKHAQAKKIAIHITAHDSYINIMVEDDGIGFNPKDVENNKKGMGLESIKKRLNKIKGTITIESKNQKGTTVIIDVPL